jgi:hypothetical protein
MQMPKRLPNRWQPESIREFRASARWRFDEGMALAAAGYRTGAMYLWGYSAEMILKAAYFTLLGRVETASLTWGGDILPAINAGRVMGIAWPVSGQGHNVRAWAELLVARHAATPGAAYPSDFGQKVQAYGQSIGQLWSESLRYHKNVAYLYEMNQVREAAEWLLVNSDTL